MEPEEQKDPAAASGYVNPYQSLPPIKGISMTNFNNRVVFLEITIGDRVIGRLLFELFYHLVPRTAENFRALCTGENKDGVGYKGSTFHRNMKDFMVQGGDFVKGNGTGAYNIYSQYAYFDDEDLMHTSHSTAGLLSMANSGPNTNGCQFFITYNKCEHLDGSHVVFGKMLDGLLTLKTMENVPTIAKDKPRIPIIISNCGEM